jgi:response regulator RpfG family c-di-GMP phosphodiesterase
VRVLLINRRSNVLGVAEALAKHMALSREHEELMRDVAELHNAGKIGAARRVMKRTEVVYERLKALETKMRPLGAGG